MKKGVFLTLGLTFFAFIVLTLSLIFSTNASRYDQRFSELASLNRVYDLSTSLGTSFAEVFRANSGMSYTASSTEAIFQATLPLNFTLLNSSFTAMSDFVKLYDNKTSSADPLPKNISISIMPQGIVFWQNITENASYYTIRVENPTAFSFVMNIPNSNITSCNTSYTSGTFSLYAYAVGYNGTSCNTTLLVNPSLNSYIGITTNSGSVVVRLSNYSASLHAGKTKVGFTSRVSYNDVVGIKEILELNQLVNVSIPSLSAKSIRNVRIA
jgi:hypothetical protein